jgi:hypothetical protein
MPKKHTLVGEAELVIFPRRFLMVSSRHRLLPWTLALAVCSLPAAAVEIVGPPFAVSAPTPAEQDHPTATFLADGSALVTWDHAKLGILGRRYDAAGAPAGPTRVLVPNRLLPQIPGEGITLTRNEPAIAALADGSLLLAFTEERAHVRAQPFHEVRRVLDRRVYLQRFAADDLAPLGAKRAALGTDGLREQAPRLTPSADGFALVFAATDLRDAGTGAAGVYLRLLDASGAFAAAPKLVAGGLVANPAVHAKGDHLLVAWEGCCDGDDLGVFARLYDRVGTALGNAVTVNARTADRQRRPAIAATGEGWLVAFQGETGEERRIAIFARHLDAAGAPQGAADHQLSSGATYTQLAPAVVAAADGGFFVTWMAWRDNNRIYSVGGVALDAAGQPTGAESWISQGRLAPNTLASLVSDGDRALALWLGAPSPRARQVVARWVDLAE